jgi:archaellum biogenesis ATPase FlaH
MVADPSSGRPTSETGTIPHELEEFLLRAPTSLLIKGAAGTGKTTLALTLVRILNSKDGFLYLSTRASPAQLFTYHPWLRDWINPKRAKGKQVDELEPPESFVDCRLDEPTQLFERVTNQLMDSTSPTIVIDTWDSLGDFRGEDSLQSNLRVLLAWCERARARLILVDEHAENTNFDAIVDGIITLKQKEIEGRRARSMVLSKLHGIDVRNPSYLFTLKDAKFRSFRQLDIEDLKIGRRSAPTRQSEKLEMVRENDFISSGYTDLDSELGGGFTPGSLVNISLGAGVDSRVALILLQKALGGFLDSGREVAVVPFEGLVPGFLESYVRSGVPTSLRALVRHEWRAHEGEKRAGRPVPKDGQGARRTAMVITGYDTFEDGLVEGKDQVKLFQKDIHSARGLGFVVTRKDGRPVSSSLAGKSATQIGIASEGGTLVLVPQSPSSRLFAVEVRRESDRPVMYLEPIA